MPQFLAEDDNVVLINASGVTWENGRIVAAPDGRAAIVEGLAGIKTGQTGRGRVRGVVTCDKASATVIAAGDRLQISTNTIPQLVTVQATGAAAANNVLCGRARQAAGSGTLTVDVVLNGTGVI
jgi:predicted RecA/RadA family phage recombinase